MKPHNIFKIFKIFYIIILIIVLTMFTYILLKSPSRQADALCKVGVVKEYYIKGDSLIVSCCAETLELDADGHFKKVCEVKREAART